MRYSHPGILILAALACNFVPPETVHALDPNARITQYAHKSWRIQDGSAPSGMYSIAQTTDGFLWFLSAQGEIFRFDGVQLQLLPLPAEARAIGRVRNILGDRTGGLWAMGAAGVVHLKAGNVTAHFELQGLLPDSNNVSLDADGSIWIVRGQNGVAEPLCHVTERALKCFGKPDGIPIAPVDAIVADGAGGLWLGGHTALVHWHSGVSEIYPLQGPEPDSGGPGILALARGPDGSIWVGMPAEASGRGLARLEKGAIKSLITSSFDGSKTGVFSLRFDHDGNLWVGTASKGVFRVHGSVVDHYARTEGLSGDFVRAFFEDQEGIVWAASNNGIDSFHDLRVTTFSVVEGLGKDWATGILAARDGTVWVANAESLDRIADGTVSSIRAGAGLPGRQVSSLLQDHAGNLWVGVDDGLYLFQNGHFRRLPEPNHQPLGLVVGITEDMDGNIWAECLGNPRRLVRIRNFQVREEVPSTKIPGGRIVPDPQAGLWIGTRGGELVLLRHGTVQSFQLHSQRDGEANQVIALADGSVLAAYDDGLFGLRQGKAQRLTTRNGLPCNNIISFIQDKDRNWWLYTKCGVVYLPDSELQRWWANPEAVVQTRLYDVWDGARPTGKATFNPAASSPDGRAWFVSGGIVQMVNPSNLSRKAPPAMAYIQLVTVDRKELPATSQLKLTPHPHDLQIDYTSPVLLVPQRVKFRYRLDHYDHDWREAGARRQAFYTDLPPGRYSFRVMACNSDGVWNENAATLDLTILPAYYQTNWFRAACVIAFLLVLWMAYQLRVRQVEQQFARTLEARVAERTRIARDLHDTLLQSFHGLLLRFQTVLHLLPQGTAPEARKELESVIDQAAAAITEGRDAVQGLRASAFESGDLASAISSLGQELAAGGPSQGAVAFRVTVEGADRKLNAVVRDEICAIAAEALRNAFHHAQAKQIEVEIRYDNQQFRLRVRDDGKGIDPAVLAAQDRAGHFGLRGMHERARLAGGTLAVWSEAGGGAELELRIPAGAAYIKDAGRSWFARKFGRKAGVE